MYGIGQGIYNFTVLFRGLSLKQCPGSSSSWRNLGAGKILGEIFVFDFQLTYDG